MNRKSITLIGVLLTCLIIPSLFVIPVLAKADYVFPSHQARGTIDEYHPLMQIPDPGDGWMPNVDTIIAGVWSVQVYFGGEGSVEFDGWYLELNGEYDGQQIPGTIDVFRLTLLPDAIFTENDFDEWEIEGYLEFHKWGWDVNTGLPKDFGTFGFDVIITVQPSEVFIDLDRYQPTSIDWDIAGVTDFFDGQEYPSASLEGNRINVYLEEDPSVPANEPCFVIHGSMYDEWSTRSYKEQKKFLKETTFELTINGEPVEMERFVHWHETYETNQGTFNDAVLISYYVQFDANHFSPGDYQFAGFWEGPQKTKYENEITVTFES